ncbi:MAG: DNA primase [Elusimicrobiota bacterium]|nr:DNA primase [Elusimicrobiota bacterium]
MIKEESIKKLLEVADIVEVIKEYVPNLKRSGKNYFILCPFHSERTPSFSIAPDKNFAHCFGCGYTANSIKFVQDIEHISFVEAAEKLARKFNVQLEYISTEEQKLLKERYDEVQFLSELLTNVAEVYHEILVNSTLAVDARKYLVNRGIKMDTVEQFKLGYAPSGNYIAKNYKDIPKLAQYDLASLHKAGIVNFYEPDGKTYSSTSKFDHPYDYFRNRILFPIFNLRGKVIGFGGRIVPGGWTEYSDAKEPPVYLNSPETAVFSKGNILYGLYQAKDHIVKEKTVCIVEGYMDVVLLSQEGIKNVVAPLGTSLTEQQVRLLNRFTQRIYLMFDPDDAGAEATLSAARIIFSMGGYPEVVSLDENIDPDEYILRYGYEKTKNLFNNSLSVVKYLVGRYRKSKAITSVIDKILLLRKLMELINSISDTIIQSEVIKELSVELGLNEQDVRTELKKYKRRISNTDIQKIVSNKPYSCEEELLWICIHYPEMIENIPAEVFSHNNWYLEIFKKLKECYTTSGDLSKLFTLLDDDESKTLISRMVFDDRKLVAPVDERVKTLYLEIYKVKTKQRYKELKPIIDEMLQGKINYDDQLINEFKQIVATLKITRR